MTGTEAFRRLASCRNSRPFIPGSFKSVTIRSTGSRRKHFNPVSASGAIDTVWPSSPRLISRRRRILGSSSTIKMLGIRVVLVHVCFHFRLHLRKDNLEAGAMTGLAGHPNCAAMRIDDFGHNRQPQTYSTFFGSNKWIENLLFHLRWNSWAGVLDLHDHSAPLLSAIRTNPEDQGSALFPHGLAGIQYEIIENLLAKLFIHHGGRQIRRIITLDIDPICYPLLCQRLQRPLN